MTKQYYNENSSNFINNTINLDMSDLYYFFEKYLPLSGKVLDIGFGSGRDSLYFSRKYEVVSIDNCEAFVEEGTKLLHNRVLLMDVMDMDFNNEFDGIWACASLLHISYNNLPKALDKCYRALKDNGIMYLSFKYGDYEGYRNGRYFTDLNIDRLRNLLNNLVFKLVETKITEDIRQDRTELWLNIILLK